MLAEISLGIYCPFCVFRFIKGWCLDYDECLKQGKRKM